MGDKKEVFTTESKVIAILEAEIISYMIPYNLMKLAFVASRLYPVSDERFWIRVDSDVAATLCVSTSLNSRLDDQGLLFGKDRKTNADVVVNLDALPSDNMLVFGPTRSGKTFSTSVLQMRLYSMLNKRVVYITPKSDAGTDFRAIAEYFGDNAAIIDIGEFGQRINPLRIIFDTQSMGSSQEAYSNAYFRHIRTVKHSFSAWFEDEFSASMKGYLEDTLHSLYKSKGIIRTKPETWKGAHPIMRELRDLFKSDMENKSGSRETRASAGALYRKTSAFGEDGSLSYLNVDTELDLSADYIVIDVSGVDEEIRPFMHVLMTGIIGSRFKTDLEKKTALIIDEARVFLKSANLSNFLLDAVSMGQAQGIQVILMTQNPNDLIKNKVDEEFKANMSLSLLFGATLDQAKVEPIKKFFNLPDSAVDDLLNCEQGEGLLLISSRQEIIPIRVEATEQERDIIKGKYQHKNHLLLSLLGYFQNMSHLKTIMA
jgi:AAA-like domain